jgi:hypothetical protein
LNGGNGSSRLNEVKLLSDSEISKMTKERFVTYEIEIKATQETIWKALTQPENAKLLQTTFDENNNLKTDWRKKSNVNYQYAKAGESTAMYAELHYGNFYIQNDYESYTDKFLLLEDEETKITELKIVCGPFNTDYDAQKVILTNWALKVKELSEIKR